MSALKQYQDAFANAKAGRGGRGAFEDLGEGEFLDFGDQIIETRTH